MVCFLRKQQVKTKRIHIWVAKKSNLFLFFFVKVDNKFTNRVRRDNEEIQKSTKRSQKEFPHDGFVNAKKENVPLMLGKWKRRGVAPMMSQYFVF